MMNEGTKRCWALVVAVSCGAVAACGERGGEPSNQASEEAAPAPAQVAAPAAPEGGEVVAGVMWEIPESWGVETPNTSMRAAQYSIPAPEGSDLEDATVAVFAGIGGTVQQNIDRWVGQMSDLEGEPQIESFGVGDLLVTHVAATGTLTVGMPMGGSGEPRPGTMLLGAVIGGGPQGNVFLKATGPREVLEAHRDEWDALLRSVKAAG